MGIPEDSTARVNELLQRTLLSLSETSGADPDHFFSGFFDCLDRVSKQLGVLFQFLAVTSRGLLLTSAVFDPESPKNQTNSPLERFAARSAMTDLRPSGFLNKKSLFRYAVEVNTPLECRRQGATKERENIREIPVCAYSLGDGEGSKGRRLSLSFPRSLWFEEPLREYYQRRLLGHFWFSGIKFPLGSGSDELIVYIHTVFTKESRADQLVSNLLGAIFANELVDFLGRSALALKPEELGIAFKLWHWKRLLARVLFEKEELIPLLRELNAEEEVSPHLADAILREAAWYAEGPEAVRPLPVDFETCQEQAVPRRFFSVLTKALEESRLVKAAGQQTGGREGQQQSSGFLMFYSGRGGVGKTSLAWKVAHLLAAKGRTCLVEADIIEPSLRSFIPASRLKKSSMESYMDNALLSSAQKPDSLQDHVQRALVRRGELEVLPSNPSHDSKLWMRIMGAVSFGRLRPAFRKLFEILKDLGFAHIIVDSPAQVRELSIAALLSLPRNSQVIYVSSTYSASLDTLKAESLWHLLDSEVDDRTPDFTLAINKLRPLELPFFRTPSAARAFIEQQTDVSPNRFHEIVGVPWSEELEHSPGRHELEDPDLLSSLNRLANCCSPSPKQRRY